MRGTYAVLVLGETGVLPCENRFRVVAFFVRGLSYSPLRSRDMMSSEAPPLPMTLPPLLRPQTNTLSSLGTADIDEDAVRWDLISPCSDMAPTPRDYSDEPDLGNDLQREAGTPSEALLTTAVEALAITKKPQFTPARVFLADEEPEAEENLGIRQELREPSAKPLESVAVALEPKHPQEEEEDEYHEIETVEDADVSSDEEIEVLNAQSLYSPMSLAEEWTSPSIVDEPFYHPSIMRESSECSDDAHTPRSSLLPRWGRMKAQTYAGSAVHSAVSKLRSHTLPTSFRFSRGEHQQHEAEEDDGDFSSDDEGYSKASIVDRGSDFEGTSRTSSNCSSTSQRSASGFQRPSLFSARLSTANLHLPRFRAHSNNTNTSITKQESCPPRPHSYEDVYMPSSQDPMAPDSRHYQMQALKLKASAAATRAAGYINSASVEAAKKLKSATSFRVASKTASETEEELDAVSPINDDDDGGGDA